MWQTEKLNADLLIPNSKHYFAVPQKNFRQSNLKKQEIGNYLHAPQKGK